MAETLTDRELATVLDALRYWQQARLTTPSFEAFTDHFHDHEPLTVGKGHDEVDALCERLNRVPAPAPAPAAATAEAQTSERTLDLLRKVAEDARDLIACNCSHKGNGWTCEGTCTHGMAVRALQQLQAQAVAPWQLLHWCERLVDAYHTLVEGDVFFDPQSDDEQAKLENATAPLDALVDDAEQQLARAAKARG